MRQYAFWIFLLLLVTTLIAVPIEPNTARTRLADGFDMPVGKPEAEGFYMSRGFRGGYHMGEDWNGLGGGDSDLGEPVFATAHGIVVLARDMHMSWGNLVIIRHIYLDEGKLKTVDSVYAHLNKIMVREGQQIVRGQNVGTIGNNRGMYPAHLHFEIRKNIEIGFNQSGYAKNFSNYYSPSAFINPRRKLTGKGRSAMVALNTFTLPSKSTIPASERKLSVRAGSSKSKKESDAEETKPSKGGFRVNRFDDVNSY